MAAVAEKKKRKKECVVLLSWNTRYIFATSNHAGEMYRQFGRLTKYLEGTIWHAYLLA